MRYIKNYDTLASNAQRKVVLSLMEAAFASVAPETVFDTDFLLKGKTLTIHDKTFDLANYERIFVLGFGKGSALMCKLMEAKLGDLITEGYVIDVVEQSFSKLQFTKGTHPLPSQENFDFTKNVIEKLSNLTEKDLVLITTCGGGSVMFEAPHTLELHRMIEVNKALLHCGATISEMNAIRKHLSRVKGGGLAKILYPATVVNLLFSDVPGNDLSVIASGPLVKDQTSIEEATSLYEKYSLSSVISNEREKSPGDLSAMPRDDKPIFTPSDFVETPKEEKYFEHVSNILMLSNLTALHAMQKQALSLGYTATVLTDRLQGDARTLGQELISKAKEGEILIAGGESTIKVTGNGKGGRNQALVMCALPSLTEGTVIASFGTDGWDFYEYAGGIADEDTLKKIDEKKLDMQDFVNDDNSYDFLTAVGDGVLTGKLESNVSDLFIVFKQKKEASITPAPLRKNETEIFAPEMTHDTTSEITDEKIHELKLQANRARQLVIETLLEAGSGHSGGPLGMADIFTAFYFHLLNHDPKNPDWEDRDRLILSNGHICPIRYVTMAMAGYFPIEELKTLRKLNSRLQGHPHRTALPGLETTSGPLGEGLSQAIGIALAGKLDKKNYHTYVLTSDGEHEEGNTWEAAQFAGKMKLNNLIQIIDYNNIQIDGNVSDIMPLEPLRAKYESFRWHVIEVDGNDMTAVIKAVEEAKQVTDKPVFIIAKTVPGKGVSFMENDYRWHGKPPKKDEADKALEELKVEREALEKEIE